jgi:hypothetical protein
MLATPGLAGLKNQKGNVEKGTPFQGENRTRWLHNAEYSVEDVGVKEKVKVNLSLSWP